MSWTSGFCSSSTEENREDTKVHKVLDTTIDPCGRSNATTVKDGEEERVSAVTVATEHSLAQDVYNCIWLGPQFHSSFR